jgi:hypothetical protein
MYAPNPSECPRLALITDVREKERQSEEWYSAEKAFIASVPVQALMDRLTKRIEEERTVAAIYRLLKNLGRHYTYGTFNRHWTGADAWIRESIRSSSIPAVLELLGEDDPTLIDEAERIEELWKRSNQPVPAIKTSRV